MLRKGEICGITVGLAVRYDYIISPAGNLQSPTTQKSAVLGLFPTGVLTSHAPGSCDPVAFRRVLIMGLKTQLSFDPAHLVPPSPSVKPGS